MFQNKTSIVKASVSLGIVILFGVISISLYQHERFLETRIAELAMYKSDAQNVQYTDDLSTLKQKIVDLEQKQNFSTNPTVANIFEDYSDLLFTVASDQFFKENSIKYNGGLRLRSRNINLFSFDIPASTYALFPDAHYSVERLGEKDATRQDSIFFMPLERDAQSVTNGSLQVKTFSYGGLPASTDPHCANTASEEFKNVALFVHQLMQDQADLQKYLAGMTDRIDLCKYIIPQKELSFVAVEMLTPQLPSFVSPPLAKDTSTKIKGYIFDFYQFAEDTRGEDKTPHSDPLLFVALPLPKQNTSVFPHARGLTVTWHTGLYPDTSIYEDNKALLAKGRKLVQATTQSIADTTILLPSCEYGGCAY